MLEGNSRLSEPRRRSRVAHIVSIAMVILLLTSVNPSQANEFESSWEVVESGTSEDLLTATEFEGEVWAFGTGGPC